MATLQNLTVDDTGFIYLPVGSTAQRPTTLDQGQLRYNSELNSLEAYDGVAWQEKDPKSPIREGLVLWLESSEYSGAGTWQDSSGSGNNGTVINNPQHIREHKSSYIVFDGSTQYVNITDNSDFTVGDSFSIEFIVKPLERTHVRPFFNKWADAPSWRLFSGQINGVYEFLFNVQAGGTNVTIESDIEFRTDQIYHIHAGYDGANVFMYVNGDKQTKTPALTGTVDATTSDIEIARNAAYNPDRFMTQEVYDAKIYNRHLTETEILHNYFVAEKKFNISEQIGSTKWNPATSARQIKSTNIDAISGTYYISSLSGPVLTYCEMTAMDGGGWTLIGKSGGGVWHDPDGWLKSNLDAQELQDTNDLSANQYACIDARLVAGAHSKEVMISNSDLNQWVYCQMHSKVSPETIFNHTFGASRIFLDAENGGSETYNSVAWNGESTLSYVNRYMIMALGGHGGPTPAWTFNARGNTATNDYAMAVACASQSHNGFNASNNYNGQDAPYNSTWPNPSYNSGHFLGCVWVR